MFKTDVRSTIHEILPVEMVELPVKASVPPETVVPPL